MVDLKKGDKFIDLNFPEEVYEFSSHYNQDLIIIIDQWSQEFFMAIKGTNMKKVEDIPRLKKQTPQKHNDNKPMMSLVRPEFITGVAEGLTYGYTKYDEKRGDVQNYLKGDGFHYSTIYDSLQRHLNAWHSGENIDPESNIEHLSLAAANLMFLHTYGISDKGVDDRTILTEEEDD